MTWIGLDIGGANLKAADTRGHAVTRPFALWRHPKRLAHELAALLAEFPRPRGLAVTMTGELCDCFETRAHGVRHILEYATAAADSLPLRVWTTAGKFVSVAEACREPLGAAAANWLALATWAGRLVPEGRGLLLDIGSTTTDIIPLQDGVPVPLGRTDTDRLWNGELVYCGVRRTPLCALFGLTAATELFATTHDVYIVLGDVPEDPGDNDTADGRPATIPHALARVARMICDEPGDGTRAIDMARSARDLQVDYLAGQVRTVAARSNEPLNGLVIAGSGEFLWPRIFQQAELGAVPMSLAGLLGPARSTAACAHAVAVLAEERA